MAAYEQAMAISEVGPIQLYRAHCVDLTLEDEEEVWVRPSCVKVREDKSDLISQLQSKVKKLIELNQQITQLEQEEEEALCECEVDDKWSDYGWYKVHIATECLFFKS